MSESKDLTEQGLQIAEMQLAAACLKLFTDVEQRTEGLGGHEAHHVEIEHELLRPMLLDDAVSFASKSSSAGPLGSSMACTSIKVALPTWLVAKWHSVGMCPLG